MSEKLVFVAGGGGFIGGHLAGKLKEQENVKVRVVDVKPLDQWYQVHPDVENIQADLNDPQNCKMAAEGAADIYNLACNMGGMGFIENNKALCMISVLINTNLIIAARDLGADRFFYSSSACVYNGDKQKSADVIALKEEDAYPALPEDGYGWEKLFSERMCRHFTEDFGLKTRVARFHNVYGPEGTWEGVAKRHLQQSAGRSLRRNSAVNMKSRSGETATRHAASCTSMIACMALNRSWNKGFRNRSTWGRTNW